MSDAPLQYSHSGSRYLLGYSETFFGIWDRRAGDAAPLHRFPRDDEGWRDAWLRFQELEPENVSVALVTRSGDANRSDERLIREIDRYAAEKAARDGAGGDRIHPAWWSLPLLFGLLGGLIAWSRNRRKDPQMAMIMLLLGLASSGMAFYVYAQAVAQTPVG